MVRVFADSERCTQEVSDKGGRQLRLERDRQTQHECAKTGEGHRLKRRHLWLIWLWPAVGLFSLIWFLIRVIPKPSRATYPCQRVAFPLASGFVVWLLGLGASAAAFRKAKSCFSRCRYFVGILCVVVSIGCVWVSLTLTAEKKARAAEPPRARSALPFR